MHNVLHMSIYVICYRRLSSASLLATYVLYPLFVYVICLLLISIWTFHNTACTQLHVLGSQICDEYYTRM